MSDKIPDVNDDSQWGELIQSDDHSFKKGDIFFLDCYGNDDETGIYRAESDWDPSTRGRLKLSRLSYTSWYGGHEWSMDDDRTLIREWLGGDAKVAPQNIGVNPVSGIDLSDWRAWAHNRPGECPCGIPRSKCEYH